MFVALYVRRSTNETLQHESLEIQENILRAYASRHGHVVAAVYRDSGSGRTTKHRPAFRQLIAHVMKALERWRAAEYSIERGRLTKAGRAQTVRNGFASGTPCPYGMQRVLVERDGSFVRLLQRGEQKALISQHVKLQPGDPAHVDVVKRIFRMYRDGWHRGDRAPSSRGTDPVSEASRMECRQYHRHPVE